MSRVFDALSRAAEERQQPVQKDESVRWISAEKIPNREDPGPNGSSAAEFSGPDGTAKLERSPNLQHGDQWSRSWRERLENILFAWKVSRYQSHPLLALEKGSAVAEQYKILREHVKKLRADTGARCLAVTSPVQRDGKTMVAVNLAAAMALDYEGKILLIDGDLRRPEVHRFFGVDPSPGLGEYLLSSGNGSLMSYLRKTSIPGLQIIPGGKPQKLSSELLARDKMKTLMQEIRVDFPEHQIIFDAPPVLSTPDPLVLGRHVDGILMVIRAGKTPREYLTNAIQSLNSTKILGLILNGVDPRSSSNYSYYSYHSSNNA
jgi:protein-tyrosine kinase